MAERSKALASGASREICVGSNPTLFTILFAVCPLGRFVIWLGGGAMTGLGVVSGRYFLLLLSALKQKRSLFS